MTAVKEDARGPDGEPPMRSALVVIIPCYNAGGRVRDVAETACALVDHVVIVDDGSMDGSAASVAGLNVELVRFPENRGKGHAMLAGFEAALARPEADCAAIIDADGQHDPAELPTLYEVFRERGGDLVIGSRNFKSRQVPWRSRLGNTLTILFTAFLLGKRLRDTQSGYRIYSRRLLERVLATLPGGRYETEMEILALVIREGLRIEAAPIQTIYEEGNPSSHFRKTQDSFRIYRTLIRAAWARKITPPREDKT
jgi:glycosyltransferase involved in cell wall biosynthesis